MIAQGRNKRTKRYPLRVRIFTDQINCVTNIRSEKKKIIIKKNTIDNKFRCILLQRQQRRRYESSQNVTVVNVSDPSCVLGRTLLKTKNS